MTKKVDDGSEDGSEVEMSVDEMIDATKIKSQKFDEAKIPEVLARVRQEAADRRAAEAQAAAEAANAIDFKKYYEETSDDPEIQAASWPLYNLYYALRRETDEEYDDKDRELFEDMDRDKVLAELDESLGDDDRDGRNLRQALQRAAQAAEGETDDGHYNYALVQAIAKHYNLTSNPAVLKQRLKQVHEALGDLFPETLDEADPYKAEVLALSDDEDE